MVLERNFWGSGRDQLNCWRRDKVFGLNVHQVDWINYCLSLSLGLGLRSTPKVVAKKWENQAIFIQQILSICCHSNRPVWSPVDTPKKPVTSSDPHRRGQWHFAYELLSAPANNLLSTNFVSNSKILCWRRKRRSYPNCKKNSRNRNDNWIIAQKAFEIFGKRNWKKWVAATNFFTSPDKAPSFEIGWPLF